MIQLTIAIFLLLGFAYNTMLVYIQVNELSSLSNQYIPAILALLLLIWGLFTIRKKRILKGWNNDSIINTTIVYIKNYKLFLKKHLQNKMPKFILFSIIILGVSNAMNRLLQGYIVPSGFPFFNSWITIWLISLLLSFFIGFIWFSIGGYIYYWLVRLSGGKNDLTISRRLYICNLLPLNIAILISILFYSVFMPKAFLTATIAIGYQLFWITVIWLSAIFSFHRSNIGVQIALSGGKIRSTIIFLIIPGLLISLVFTGLIFGILKIA